MTEFLPLTPRSGQTPHPGDDHCRLRFRRRRGHSGRYAHIRHARRARACARSPPSLCRTRWASRDSTRYRSDVVAGQIDRGRRRYRHPGRQDRHAGLLGDHRHDRRDLAQPRLPGCPWWWTRCAPPCTATRCCIRSALNSIRTELFPLATLVTPNLDEVRLLVDVDGRRHRQPAGGGPGAARAGPAVGAGEGRTPALLRRAVPTCCSTAPSSTSSTGRASTPVTTTAPATPWPRPPRRALAHGYTVPDAVAFGKRWVTECLRAAYPLGHGHGPVNALFEAPASDARRPGRGRATKPDGKPKGTVVLTHGAGGNRDSPMLVRICDEWARHGYLAVRYNLPYRRRRPKGRRRTRRNPIRRGIVEAIAWARGLGHGPVLAGGHSYGGRMTSMVAADEPLRADCADACSPHPLHPPGKPERARTEHLPGITAPTVFTHGTADPFGTIDEIRAGGRAGDRADRDRRGQRGPPRSGLQGLWTSPCSR